MTYNAYIRNSDADQIASIVKEHHPDIVGLHELRKGVAEALENRLSEQYPYLEIESGCCGILSRYPILDYQTFQLGEDRAQQATLDLDGRPVNVFNVHLQIPLETTSGSFDLSSTEYVNDLRDANVQDLLSRLGAMDTPVIVIGDFNLTDQQRSYAALTHRLRDAHHESGWGMGFTARILSLGLPMWRIDYVFYSPQLVALRTAFGDFGASDHRPVIAELAFTSE
jgi:endonuclease/exonuclease/phosphatase (EEP) superfamily protein YafD